MLQLLLEAQSAETSTRTGKVSTQVKEKKN
jgi:hypothetical protein